MMTILTAMLLTVLAVTAQTDTTFKVRPGSRLNVNNFGGEIAVRAWGRNTVRIEAAHAERMRVRVEALGSDIEVRASSRRGIPGRVDYRITAPEWMPLSLSGIYADVSVEGAKSEVSAETVKGDVRVLGGDGFIRLSSIQGAVCVGGARGRLELSSVDQGVSVSDAEGDISVDAVNGDVTLEGIRSGMVEAATVNGDVTYVGEIRAGGRYRLASHSGNLFIVIPRRASARVSVATFSGDLESDFPVSLTQAKKGGRFDFTLGSGSARIDLETFLGTINLQRAAGARASDARKATPCGKEKE
jgi:DUF4097 and DUF4098 domain-containing protein YvlB